MKHDVIPRRAFNGVVDRSKQISKADMGPYEEDIRNQRYLLKVQVGDVSGDGIPDRVYLKLKLRSDVNHSIP